MRGKQPVWKSISPVEVDEADENDEEKKVQMLPDPGAPTEQEIQRHEVTHLPYRSWCPQCVKGRARARGHKKEGREEGAIPRVVLDYAFMGQKDDEDAEKDKNKESQIKSEEKKKSMPMLVMKDARSKYVFSTWCCRKDVTTSP